MVKSLSYQRAIARNQNIKRWHAKQKVRIAQAIEDQQTERESNLRRMKAKT